MWPLLFVMAAGAVVWTVSMYRRTQPSPTVRLRRLLILLRSLALEILVLAVAGPVLVHLWTRLDETQVVIVLEDSASMALADDEPNPDEDTGHGADRWCHGP